MFVISAASALNIGAVVRTPAVQRGNRPLLMSSVDEAERANQAKRRSLEKKRLLQMKQELEQKEHRKYIGFHIRLSDNEHNLMNNFGLSAVQAVQPHRYMRIARSSQDWNRWRRRWRSAHIISSDCSDVGAGLRPNSC